MHISFNVRPEKNLNEFVVALEKSAHEQGYYEVICNRLFPVKLVANGRADVKGIPVTDNSFEVKSGALISKVGHWLIAKGLMGNNWNLIKSKVKRKRYLIYGRIYLVVQINCGKNVKTLCTKKLRVGIFLISSKIILVAGLLVLNSYIFN